jgi:8-amino-7-oxononanoate synthase
LIEASLTETLTELDSQALRRRLPEAIERPGTTVERGDRRLLNLSSNNYLGLATHPDVVMAAVDATMRSGCSATGSRLLAGNLTWHERLEARIAQFKGTEAALLFNSGYVANLGVLTALTGPGDLIVADKLNHASLIDGARASEAEVRHAPHQSMERMEALLDKPGVKRRFVVTDGVFSMDGDIARLPELLSLCRRYEATLVLDEAHATGVLGATGRGTLEHYCLGVQGVIQVGTLSKALGGFGAFVAGSQAVIESLINLARPLVFSTALPPAVIGAALAAFDVLDFDPGLVERLRANAIYLREGLQRIGLQVPSGITPIIPVVVGEPDVALKFAQHLDTLGVLAQAVRPPSVPRGSARVRVTVMAPHTREQLDRAIAAFETAGRRAGILT